MFGLSTNGFAPWKRRKKTCWPLLLYNYNLPPNIRFHLEYILCIGVIPGPRKPKDFDSFIWPMVQEFLKLEHDTWAFDVSSSEMFVLHVYLCIVFGDIPASMVMRMKGHNGVCPCRMCNIRGIKAPDGKGNYVPLDHTNHPDVQADPSTIPKYDPAQLPLRTHSEMKSQAEQVQFTLNTSQSDKLATAYGIKGTSILMVLSSLSFPGSFPYDFMHLMFENIIKNLVLLWTCALKGLDAGTGSYELAEGIWEALGATTEASGSMIPSAFGLRPPDVADDKQATMADSWSFWLLYVGPTLLQDKFHSPVYHCHLCDLSSIVNTCLQFEHLKGILSSFAKTVSSGLSSMKSTCN